MAAEVSTENVEIQSFSETKEVKMEPFSIDSSVSAEKEKLYGVYMKVWNVLDENDALFFSRPLYQQIPNFKGADVCGEKMMELEEVKNATTVYCDNDRVLGTAKLQLLMASKTVLTPLYRSKRSLLCKHVPPEGASKQTLKYMLKSERGEMPIDESIHIDLLVLSSVAVHSNGSRIGRSDYFSNALSQILLSLGYIDETTKVITLAHDLQFCDIQSNSDLAADVIVTPTQVIECKQAARSFGERVDWRQVSGKMLERVPFLASLRYKEMKAGLDVCLAGEEMTDALIEDLEKLNLLTTSLPAVGRLRTAKRIKSRKNRTKKPSTDDSGHSTQSPGTSQERSTKPGIVVQSGAESADEIKIKEGESRRTSRRNGNTRRNSRRHSRQSEAKTTTTKTDEDGNNVPEKYPSSTTTNSHDGTTRRRRRMNIVMSRRTKRPLSEMPCLYLGGLTRNLRNFELRRMVKECAVKPAKIIRPVFGAYAFLYFESMDELQSAETALGGLQQGTENTIRIELGRRSQHKQQPQDGSAAAGSAGEDEEEEPAII